MAQEAFWNVRRETSELLRKQDNRPLHPLSLLAGVVFPVLLFVCVYQVVSSSIRFYNWPVAVAVGPLAGFVICAIFTKRANDKRRLAEPARGPLALAVCLWLALVLGCVMGDQNYNWYVTNVYTYQDAATYTDIDPIADRGQSFMDAGQVYFREGTYVAKKEMSTFRSSNLYCIAPIVGQPIRNQVVDEQPTFSWDSDKSTKSDKEGRGTPSFRMPESGTIDFWAVGMDCCNQTSGEFWCGQANSIRARAGMRMLRDDSRPFYLLAVQAWAAKRCPEDMNTVNGVRKQAPLICLPAKHPLFFYWVVDPILEVDTFSARSSSLFSAHTAIFIGVDFAICASLLWLFYNIGVR